MTDNEIVKALECCMGCGCKECPNFNENDIDEECCMGRLIVEALKLVNRQKAEIERYKENMPYLEQQSLDFCGVLCDFAEELIAKYKSEAVKKFADRLKADLGDPFLRAHGCVEPIVNNLVKEMTEETK